jgi:hypothetical protein
MALHTLYVNAQYGNEVTLDHSMASKIDAFGDMTWRTLLTEVKGQSIEWLLEGENLMDHFGIEVDQLEESIDQDDITKYYTDIADYTDNHAAAEAGAFELLVELDIFLVDRDSNGNANGVCLAYFKHTDWGTYADYPLSKPIQAMWRPTPFSLDHKLAALSEYQKLHVLMACKSQKLGTQTFHQVAATKGKLPQLKLSLHKSP